MATVPPIHDFTEVRIGAYDGLYPHVFAPDGIWADDGAVEIQPDLGSADPTAITMHIARRGGLEAPEQEISYTPLPHGMGEAEMSNRLRGREIVLPVSAPVGAPLEKLKAVCLSRRPLLVGFRRDPIGDSTYLPLCRLRGGFPNSLGGHAENLYFELRLKSVWPYPVSPQTAARGQAATLAPDGPEKIAWGVWMDTMTSASLTITLPDGRQAIMGFSSQPARVLFSPSGQFSAQAAHRADGSRDTAVGLATYDGNLPPFLAGGETYRLGITGGQGRAFWLRNNNGA